MRRSLHGFFAKDQDNSPHSLEERHREEVMK